MTIIIVAIIYSGIQKDNAVVAENEKVAKKINDQIDEKNKKDKEIFKCAREDALAILDSSSSDDKTYLNSILQEHWLSRRKINIV